MLKAIKANHENLALALSSLAILAFLGLQFYTAKHLRGFWIFMYGFKEALRLEAQKAPFLKYIPSYSVFMSWAAIAQNFSRSRKLSRSPNWLLFLVLYLPYSAQIYKLVVSNQLRFQK